MAAHKLALVLSGGGMGGAAHIGAIQALEEHGLIPDVVLGTSIGAFVGSVYASGATAEMLIEGWRALSRKDLSELLDPDLGSFLRALSTFDHRHITGLLMGRALMHVQTRNFVCIRTFAELARLSPAERKAKNIKSFYACATSLLDGVETIFCEPGDLELDENGLYKGRRLCHHVSFDEAVRASFGLPAIFKPYQIALPYPANSCHCWANKPPDSPDYHLYVDGAVKDDYPITIAAKIAKADKIIGINLTKSGAKADLTLNGGLPDLQSRILKIIGEDQYEADRADKDVSKADLITIDPAIGDIGMFDMRLGDWLIERGYQAVKQCFAQKGLRPTLSRQENLDRLFPPLLLDYCPDCGQKLPSPRDLGTHEHFVAQLTPYQSPQADNNPAKTNHLNNHLTFLRAWRPPYLLLIGLLILFFVGGFQFWWVYQLPNSARLASLVFIGGGFMYMITVLAAVFLIGSWLILLIKNLFKRLLQAS